VLGFGAVGTAMLVAFVFSELRAARPMIDVRLFRFRLFTAGNAILFFSTAGFAGMIFLLPLLLQAERGMSPLESGLTTFPQAIGVLMMAPLAGRLYHRVGPRRLLIAGMLGATVVTFAFRYVELGTSAWWIRGLMLVRGWAFALGLVPLQAATFAEVQPSEAGHASAAMSVIRQVASSFGVALLATVLTSRMTMHQAMLGNPATQAGATQAFHDAFVAASLIGVVSIAMAFLVSDKLAAGTMRRATPTRVPERQPDDVQLAAD
jgi:MFS family permease